MLRICATVSAVLLVLSASAPATAADASTRMPWPTPAVRIVAGFHIGDENWEPGHRGVDLRAMAGELLRSPLDGVVRFSGIVNDRPVLSLLRADGLVVTLEPVTSSLQAGDGVTTGMAIGEVATGGHCAGNCVHLGVIVGGEYHSPLRYFIVPFARLLPLFSSSAVDSADATQAQARDSAYATHGQARDSADATRGQARGWAC